MQKFILLLLILPLLATAQSEHDYVLVPSNYPAFEPSMNYGGCSSGVVGSKIQCRGYGLGSVTVKFKLQTYTNRDGSRGINLVNPVCRYNRTTTYYYLENDNSRSLKALSVADLAAAGKYKTGNENFVVNIALFYDHRQISDTKIIVRGGAVSTLMTSTDIFTAGKLSKDEQADVYANVWRITCTARLSDYEGTCADCDFVAAYLAKVKNNSNYNGNSNNNNPGNGTTATGNTNTSNKRSTSSDNTSNTSPAGNTGKNKVVAKKEPETSGNTEADYNYAPYENDKPDEDNETLSVQQTRELLYEEFKKAGEHPFLWISGKEAIDEYTMNLHYSQGKPELRFSTYMSHSYQGNRWQDDETQYSFDIRNIASITPIVVNTRYNNTVAICGFRFVGKTENLIRTWNAKTHEVTYVSEASFFLYRMNESQFINTYHSLPLYRYMNHLRMLAINPPKKAEVYTDPYYTPETVAAYKKNFTPVVKNICVQNLTNGKIWVRIYRPDNAPGIVWGAWEYTAHQSGTLTYPSSIKDEIPIGDDWGIQVSDDNQRWQYIFFVGELCKPGKNCTGYNLVIDEKFVNDYIVNKKTPLQVRNAVFNNTSQTAVNGTGNTGNPTNKVNGSNAGAGSYYTVASVSQYRKLHKPSVKKLYIQNSTKGTIWVRLYHPDNPGIVFCSTQYAAGESGSFTYPTISDDIHIGDDWGIQVSDDNSRWQHIFFVGELCKTGKGDLSDYSLAVDSKFITDYLVNLKLPKR